MKFGTKSYTQETPVFLWKPFKHGPADDYDRIHDRITELIAFDLLVHDPEQFTEQERERAEALAANLPFDLPDSVLDTPADDTVGQTPSSASNPGVDVGENGSHPGGER